MSRRAYLTTRRVQAVGLALTAHDRALLSDVTRLRVVSGGQLRRLHYPDTESGARAARRDLRRLTDSRVLQRLDRRIGGVRAGSDGFVYALDVVGQRLASPERRARWWPSTTPTERTLAHRLATTELYVNLRELERQGVVELSSFEAEPACWRSFVGPGGGRLALKPDAAVVTASADLEHHWFVETDRATESLPWILTKARVYIRYWQTGREQARSGLFPKVLWVVPTKRRAEHLTDTLSALPAEHWRLFAVVTADQAFNRLAGINQPTEELKEVTS